MVSRGFLQSFGLLALGACSSSSGVPANEVADAGDAEASGDSSEAGSADVSESAASDGSVDEQSPESAVPIPDASDAALPRTPLWQVFYDRSFAAHVEVDSQGAAIVSGSMFQEKDIRLGGSVLKSHGSGDVMLSRVLPGGAVDWAKSYGGLAEDYPVIFRIEKNDDIVMTGLYNGTGNIGGPDFPAFAGTAGRYDVFVAGLDKAGGYRWSKTINTTADAFAGGLSLDGDGHAFVAGHFMGTATINAMQQPSAGSWDAFLARFDEPNGAFGPILPMGGAGDERSSVAVFTGTDVVVLGTFTGTLTMPTPVPTQLVSAGARDIFIARISTDGKMTSAMSFGGSGDEQIAQAMLDQNGNVVIAGSFSSPTLSVLGGDSLLSAGGYDAFAACLSPALAHQWSKNFGGDADDLARDLTIGPDGVIGLVGEFRNHIAFGDEMHDAARADAGVSEIDAFVVKLSEQGNTLWSYTKGGPAPDRALAVASDAEGALYVAVSFQSPIDFGFGLLTPDPGQWASALVKFAP